MALLIAALVVSPLGNMYDVVMHSYVPGCKNGCAAWASLSPDVAKMFATADGPAHAHVCMHV